MNASLPIKKEPVRAEFSVDEKLLIGRREAAAALSISQRALDYLVAEATVLSRATFYYVRCSFQGRLHPFRSPVDESRKSTVRFFTILIC